MNPDGSLDDSSVPDGSVAKEMLPACEAPAKKTAPKPGSAQTAVHPVAKSDNSGMRTELE